MNVTLSLRDPQLIFVYIYEAWTTLALRVPGVRHPYDTCQTSVPNFLYFSKLQHIFTLLRHYGDLKMCRTSDVQCRVKNIKFDEVIFNFLVYSMDESANQMKICHILFKNFLGSTILLLLFPFLQTLTPFTISNYH